METRYLGDWLTGWFKDLRQSLSSVKSGTSLSIWVTLGMWGKKPEFMSLMVFYVKIATENANVDYQSGGGGVKKIKELEPSSKFGSRSNHF